MTNSALLADRLKEFAVDLNRWRSEALRLRSVADEAISAKQVDEDVLVKVEHSAGVLYEEIKSFDALVADVAGESPAAAGELAPVDDALHLLLLEITELGTRLYSLRSRDITGDPLRSDADQPALLTDDGAAQPGMDSASPVEEEAEAAAPSDPADQDEDEATASPAAKANSAP